MDFSQQKKVDENDNLAGIMEAVDSGKEVHGQEEKQHSHSHGHSHNHEHHNHREEHVDGWKSDLLMYVPQDAQSTAGAFLSKEYLKLTGKKYDKVVGLIGPEQIGKGRKEDEAEAGEKNKGVSYEF